MTAIGGILRGEARDAIIFTGSNLLNRLGGFLVLPLYWSQLSPDDYGVLAVIAVIGAFQTLFSSLSLDLAITRLYYQWADADRRRNLGAIWTWNWLTTVACGGLFLLLFLAVGPWLFPDVPYHPWLLLGIISNTLANLFVIPASAIRIKRLPWLFATYNLGSFAVSAGLGLWFVLVLEQGLHGYLVSTLWANGALALVGGIVMLRFSRPGLSSPGLREAFRFALPAMPSDLINTAGSILDRFLLSYFANLYVLGVYAVSLKFVEVLGALHASLKMTFGPFMMKNIAEDRERGSQMVVSVTPYYLIPYFAGGLGLCLFIGPVVRLIDQPEYYAVVDWVPWLAGIHIISCLYFYYSNGMVLGNRTDLLSVPAGVQLAVMLVASVLLVGPYQLTGIVVSRYLAGAVFFGLSLYLSQKVFYLPHRWGALLGLAGAALAFAVAGQYLTVDSPAWEITARAPLWAGFLAVGWWMVRTR